MVYNYTMYNVYYTVYRTHCTVLNVYAAQCINPYTYGRFKQRCYIPGRATRLPALIPRHQAQVRSRSTDPGA